jgi:hypothetical protein
VNIIALNIEKHWKVGPSDVNGQQQDVVMFFLPRKQLGIKAKPAQKPSVGSCF